MFGSMHTARNKALGTVHITELSPPVAAVACNETMFSEMCGCVKMYSPSEVATSLTDRNKQRNG
eukprot:scaffold410078_cov27-Prasinocladus_malaysianus.AAC.1